MVAFLKVVHIAGIAFWCGGRLALPSLYVRRSQLRSRRSLLRLHRFTRFTFIRIASPAAFIAIATGLVLIFLRDVFTTWMVLKLAGIGLLVLIHIWSSQTLIHVFDGARSFGRLQQALMVLGTMLAVAAILYLVLGKPEIDIGPLPRWLQPGAAQSSAEIIIPTPW